MTFWDLLQQRQIDKNKSDIITAKDKAIDAKDEAKSVRAELISKVDRLSMICQALWEIVQELHGTTEEELIKKVQEIDLRDGSLDGKFTKEISKCSDCGRAMNARHNECIYCGSPRILKNAFEQL